MILKEIADLMDVACKTMGLAYADVRICELGDQIINRWHPLMTGKQYLINKGVKEHISIDWNGQNGAVKRDLSLPINEWKHYFDIITNYGTTEHVTNQYCVFKNIHDFCKKGGVMIHTVPIIGGWKNHCLFHYDTNFFGQLSQKSGYKCIINENREVSFRGSHKMSKKDRTLVCSVLLKEKDVDFMDKLDFAKIGENHDKS